MNTELDMTVDDESWPNEHPVYCPVPWCAAHDLRGARCGDKDGDYVGIHVARIEYAKGEARRVERALQRRRDAGVADPELALAISRMLQDSIDMGTVKLGRKGRRRL
jgi:hypothetical protein